MILVVDDDPSLCRLLEIVLRQAGFTVLSAHAGVDALKLLKQGAAVELLVAESDMPDVNGVELAQRARSISPHLPVLLLAGRFVNRRPDGLECDFLPKPFMPDDFVRSVRKLLQHSARLPTSPV